jgi:N-glycosidase YbiA
MIEEKTQITRFVGDFAFLSNFHNSVIFYGGKKFQTVEHAYQAHKTLIQEEFELIRNAKTPGEAKKLGRKATLRSDWDSVKVSLMKEFLIKKFENPFLSALLLATDDAELIEENYWNDTFWGVCRGHGKNMLGILLVEVREDLKKQIRHENKLFE